MWTWRRRTPNPPLPFGTGIIAVLIDMQEHYVRNLAQTDRDTIIAGQQQVLAQCVDRDIPLIVAEYAGNGPTLPVLESRITLVPRVRRVTKSDDDAFTSDEMEAALRELGGSTLLLMGINASFCVLRTARSALDHGYRLVTADNLIADSTIHAKKDKHRHWYRRNGTFLQSAPLDLETV